MARIRPSSHKAHHEATENTLRHTKNKGIKKLQKEEDALRQREAALIKAEKNAEKALEAAHSLATNVLEHESGRASSLTSRSEEVLDRIRQSGFIKGGIFREEQDLEDDVSKDVSEDRVQSSTRDELKRRKALMAESEISASEESAEASTPNKAIAGATTTQPATTPSSDHSSEMVASPSRKRSKGPKRPKLKNRTWHDPFRNVQLEDLTVYRTTPRRAGEAIERPDPMATVRQEQLYFESIARAQEEEAMALRPAEAEVDEAAAEPTGRRRKPNKAERMGRSRRRPKPLV